MVREPISHRPPVSRTGSLLGREHARVGRNNQDAFATGEGHGWHAVAVTDGCSGGRASEVGARLGAAFLAAHAPSFLAAHEAPLDAARSLVHALTASLDALAFACAVPALRPAFVAEHLLFSFLVAAVGPTRVLVFGVGDGVVLADGDTWVIDPGPENAPPYVGYRLVPQDLLDLPLSEGALDPRVHLDLPREQLSVVGVSTDGLGELLARERSAALALLGGPADLENPSLLEKRLRTLALRGLAPADDLTLAVLHLRGLS